MGVVLCAAVIRAVIEGGTLAAVAIRPDRTIAVRRGLARLGLVALYVGVPSWLLFRVAVD
jgi:apolipoprotein N-acyltransferase